MHHKGKLSRLAIKFDINAHYDYLVFLYSLKVFFLAITRNFLQQVAFCLNFGDYSNRGICIQANKKICWEGTKFTYEIKNFVAKLANK